MLAHDVSVNVAGEAKVEQTLRLDVTLDPMLRATLDALQNMGFSVPLLGSADTGRMDTDAAPQRTGGIGHQ